MKIVPSLALIAAIGLAAPALVWPQTGSSQAPPPKEGSQERPMKRELPPEVKQLLERQREEMRALREKHREERRKLREKLQQERKEGGAAGPPEKKSL